VTLARCVRLTWLFIAAVLAQARALGLAGLLGPACRHRDLVMALIVSRVIRPESKLATISAWADSTIGIDLDVAGASTDELYAAMDWLLGLQDAIEANLALRHLSVAANPSEMALFDLSSSWMEGTRGEWPVLPLRHALEDPVGDTADGVPWRPARRSPRPGAPTPHRWSTPSPPASRPCRRRRSGAAGACGPGSSGGKIRGSGGADVRS
jgi:hypothetical protein